MIKKRTGVVLSLLCACLLSHAQDLGKADKAFAAGQFQQAYDEYKKVIAAKPAQDVLYKAQLRSAESLKNLFRFEKAAKDFSAYEMPKDPVWEARFLLYRTYFAQQNINAYGYALSEDIEEGTEDLGKRTEKQWQDAIEKDYARLFALRKELINAPIQNEEFIINIKDTDTARMPTLYDFAASKIKTFYQNKNDKEKVKEVLIATADLDGANRTLAKQNAVIDYIDYTKTNEEFVDEMLKIAGYTPASTEEKKEEKTSFISKIKGIFTSSKKETAAQKTDGPSYFPPQFLPEAKARAAFEAAQRLNFMYPADKNGEWNDEESFPSNNTGADYERVVSICLFADKNNFDTYYTEQCRRMIAEIELPVLNMQDLPAAPNPQFTVFKANVRNIDKVYTRVYAVTEKELKDAARSSYQKSTYQHLRRAPEEFVQKLVLKTPSTEIETPVVYEKKYIYKDIEINIPPQKTGLYVVMHSDKKDFPAKKSIIKATVMNISDLMLLASTAIEGKPENFAYDAANPNKTMRANVLEFYTLNPQTGEPVADVQINALEGYSGNASRSLSTRKDGTANADYNINLNYRYYNNNTQFDPLARKDGSIAYLSNPVYFNYNSEYPYKVFIEMDRAIYRPKQEVQLKITALEKTPKGFKTMDAARKVTIEVRDTNYKNVVTGTLPLSSMGTAAYKFTIPEGRLLGSYSINASISGIDATGYANFRVEEYKRPEFEVKLKDAAGPWTYGAQAKVEGDIKYYFGGPVANADVEYKVTRENYIPYFCWWWPRPNSANKEVAQGKIKADDNGYFSFNFTPDDKDNNTSRFVVEINARDAGGRTIKDSKAFLAAKENIFFNVDIPTGFIDAGKTYKIGVSLVDINAAAIDGKWKAQLYTLDKKYEDSKAEKRGYYYQESVSLESAFEKTKELQEIYSIELFSDKKKKEITLPALEEGVYRLKLTSGKQENKFVLISVSEGKTLALPAVAIAERGKYYPGESARFLIGTDKLQKAKYFKVLKQAFVLEKNIVNTGGVSVVAVPVKEEHRGGFDISFFGVSDYKTYSAQAKIDVPRNNSELTLKLNTPEKVKPGEKVSWTLEAKDYKNNPVNGEATVRVYDRSLDYYAKLEPALTFEALFQDNSWYSNRSIISSLFNVYPSALDYEREWKASPQQKPLPHLIMEYSYRSYGGRGVVHSLARSSAAMMDMDMSASEESAPAPKAMMAMSANKQKAETTAAGGALQAADKAEAGADVPVRENMAETAYFGPQVNVLNGKGTFGFTMPERLTGWNILASVLTKDVKLGTVTAQTVTKKDLMVRMEMPRFLREKDKAQIKALINNDTKNTITTDVSLLIKEEGKNAYEVLNLLNNTQKVTIAPNSQSVVTWNADVISGVRVLTLTAVARAGSLSDGETKELPILPSRERVVDSKVSALKEGKNDITLNLGPDATREYEAVSLQVDPSLLLPVLNTVPQIIDYSYCYETTPTIVNRYVPLAIINSFYNKYPQLKNAVAKIPKRDTITPAWDDMDPTRLLMMQETPWQSLSEGREAWFGNVVDIFNPKTVSKMESSAFEKLVNYQNSDGSFAWLPGGKGDEYMTLYVLEAFAEALNNEAKIPEGTVKKAIKYTQPKIEDIIKKSEREDEYTVSLALYAAYVISSFPADWSDKKTISNWIEFTDRQNKFMTPLGKIYAANVYHRLGDKTKADFYLDAVLDMLRVDATAGAYFTPEAKSWLWYSDTLQKHAMTLRTLLRLRPEDSKIDEMLKWMLFNRKSNEWRNTKAAATAVYTLLDIMKAKGSFTTDTSYNIIWGDVKETLVYKPFDFVAKPPTYVKYGADATDKNLTASVTKTGKIADFVSLTAIYTTDEPVKKSEDGLLNVDRTYFLRVKEGDGYKLKPLASGDTVNVGDEIQIQLSVKTSSQFEYVLIKDPRGAGFEAETLTSGWKWDMLSRYEEPKDNATNFFINWLPHGEYTLKYTVRPTTPGDYKIGAAVIQSMFAPEFAAHSAGMTLKVK